MALTTQQMLDEARVAYHALVTGQAVAEFRDQNGETIRYSKADTAKLAAYIASLEKTLDSDEIDASRPMKVFM